jgi:short-subunit dehydrogenase
MELAPGTRVLVTGASRGIGKAVADAFEARGCTVGRVSRSGELAGDVADRESIAGAVERFGGADVLVANAGIAHYLPFAEMPNELVEELTTVNWLGTVYTVQAALPGMLERGRGHVVIVSSGAGIRSFPGAAVYGATKAAQRGFGEALRHELSGTGVSLTMVYPGEVATALHEHEKDRMPDWYRGGPHAASAEGLAKKVIAAVEGDARAVHYPPLVRVLGAVHGLSPKLADRMLRAMRGATAAPRRD